MKKIQTKKTAPAKMYKVFCSGDCGKILLSSDPRQTADYCDSCYPMMEPEVDDEIKLRIAMNNAGFDECFKCHKWFKFGPAESYCSACFNSREFWAIKNQALNAGGDKHGRP